ncbi:MAG TPA: YdeI/OmpD-associated family protein [Rubellimicrobium sp.]|nr:YdeI/OmpD-associated family protein [Rubellimicrobium sp.]
MIRFNDSAQVADRADLILSYLREAMGYAEQGLRPPKEEAGLELPDELIEALDVDSKLAEAFHTLTPGRQRSYAIALSSAKASATRAARIAKFRGRILAGKGAVER